MKNLNTQKATVKLDKIYQSPASFVTVRRTFYTTVFLKNSRSILLIWWSSSWSRTKKESKPKMLAPAILLAASLYASTQISQTNLLSSSKSFCRFWDKTTNIMWKNIRHPNRRHKQLQTKIRRQTSLFPTWNRSNWIRLTARNHVLSSSSIQQRPNTNASYVIR